MVTQIIQSGNTLMHIQNPIRMVYQGSLFDVQDTPLQTQAAFGPFSEVPSLFPPAAVNTTIPQLILRTTTFISWTWWPYCIPPHCSEIIRWALMICEHNSIPVTDTIKGGRINFQKTNFNQNKKIVDH